MADGIVDELLLKIGVKVDDKEFVDLQKQVKELQKGSANIRPGGMRISDNMGGLTSDNSNPEDKETVRDIADNIKDSKESLKKIAESTQKSEDEKRKDKEKISDGGGSDLDSSGLLALALKILDVTSIIQQKYTEKLNRDVDIASLAYETNLTTDSIKELGYRSKLVGVSLDSIVENSKQFSNEVFNGGNDQQIALANSLGIDLVGVLRKAKTPLETAKAQATIYNDAYKALLPTFGFAGASAKASNLSGLSADEAFRYQHLGDKTVIDGARELSKLRGPMGSKSQIFSNLEQNNLSLEKVKAATDRALSSADAAKRISIDRADFQANFVNLIAKGINGLGDKKVTGAFNIGYDQNFTDNYFKQSRSAAITKAGGN